MLRNKKVLLLFLFMAFAACKGSHKALLNRMQENIDSASRYYDDAIRERENGINVQMVTEKYTGPILLFYHHFKDQFDSLGNKYAEHHVDSATYFSIIQQLKTDSVSIKNQRLQALGVNIQLN